MNEILPVIIWAAIIGTAFALLWRKGYLLRFGNYIEETREELRKCSWPTREELKGSTMVVLVSIVVLGVFTMVVDFVVSWLVKAVI